MDFKFTERSEKFFEDCLKRKRVVGISDETKGYKVMVTKNSIENGSRYDQEDVRQLIIGYPYEIEKIDIGTSSSCVYLKGFSSGFNSVNFEDYDCNYRDEE